MQEAVEPLVGVFLAVLYIHGTERTVALPTAVQVARKRAMWWKAMLPERSAKRATVRYLKLVPFRPVMDRHGMRGFAGTLAGRMAVCRDVCVRFVAHQHTG